MLRDRLRENEVVQANFILVLGNMIEERWASEWWEGFAKMKRAEFEWVARGSRWSGGAVRDPARHRGGGGSALPLGAFCNEHRWIF